RVLAGGAFPALRLLLSVDDDEAAEARELVTLAAPARQEPRGCADAAGEHEPCAERSDPDPPEVPAKLRTDIRRLADLLAQRVDGVRELRALGVDLAPDDFGGAPFRY